jgi:hypothetical protein
MYLHALLNNMSQRINFKRNLKDFKVKKKHENFLDGEKAVLRGKFINIFVD